MRDAGPVFPLLVLLVGVDVWGNSGRHSVIDIGG